MPPPRKFVRLPDSQRQPVADSRIVDEVNPSETFEITVRVRPTSKDKAALLKELETGEQHYLSREQFAQKFGANPCDLEKVTDYAHENGLTVVNADAAQRTVVLRGTAKALTAAFPTELKQYDSPAGRFRGRTGEVQVPEELSGIVEGIFGFDNRPQAKPRTSESGA